MKRSIITILILITALLISSCSSGASRKSEPEKKPVASAVNTETAISGSYEGLDKLPQEYPSELAQKNGDVVGVHGKTYNIDKLDKFIETSKDNKSDMVRITTYTIEGDAIIYVLIREDEGFKLLEDYTRDEFSSSENRTVREYKVTGILKQNKDECVYYMAKLDNGNEIPLLFMNNK